MELSTMHSFKLRRLFRFLRSAHTGLKSKANVITFIIEHWLLNWLIDVWYCTRVGILLFVVFFFRLLRSSSFYGRVFLCAIVVVIVVVIVAWAHFQWVYSISFFFSCWYRVYLLFSHLLSLIRREGIQLTYFCCWYGNSFYVVKGRLLLHSIWLSIYTR